jgi:microcystin-dependent protein
MSKHRQLSYGQPVPQDFLDALQEFIGSGSRNLVLTQIGANQIQIAAGVGNAQVALGIDGLWRYVSTTVQTTVTGGAGTYTIFATTGANAFATNPSPPPPEIDSTDYTFALTALLTGNPTTPHYRKIGEAIFDGTRITGLRQTVGGAVDGSQLWQPGDIKLTGVVGIPAGWLPCDGSAVSRNAYPALYAVLGGANSPWGQGDGATTFNVPDLRSRTPVGAGQGGGLSNRAAGSYGGGTLDTASPTRGEETHILANGEMPTHSHGGGTGNDSPDHAHGVAGGTGTESADHTHGSGGSGDFATTDGSLALVNIYPAGGVAAGHTPAWLANRATVVGATTGRSAAHSHSFSVTSYGANARHAHGIGNDGGGGAHNNMPPWVAATYIIKT